MLPNNNNNRTFVPLVPFMPENPMVGYSYVPYQTDPEYFTSVTEAYNSGTVFPELTIPYSNNNRRTGRCNYE